ncbi:S1 family peptidase [Gigaspora margarita]|uniref:S1 family peptidase n=1 Tax=Gigaspora margarita TaxID=4874 RepID=A0A8H4A644_GIGMA|nr:S1 family peptidase [Gigaspora margarita]
MAVDDIEIPMLLKNERNLIWIDEILRPILEQDDFISSIGGTYINIFKNYIVVNTVNNSKVNDLLSLPQIIPYKDFLYFNKAYNSLSQMQHDFSGIKFLVYQLRPKRLFIYTDMEINNNVIYIIDRNFNNSEFIDATRPFNPTIIFHKFQKNPSVSQNLAQSRRDVDSHNLEVKVLGGDGILNEYYGFPCSVGFWVTSIDPNDFYIVTAGHCDAFGVYSYYPWGSKSSSGLLIGPMNFNLTNNIYDVGIISFEYQYEKNVVPTFSIRNDGEYQYKELIITNGAPVSSHNVHICKSDYTTHLTCGRVFGLNGIATGYTEEEDDLYDLIITDFYSAKGDSGGPAFSFGSPQNLYSVVLHGIFVILNSAIQPIDKIFKALYEHERYYKLYLGRCGVHKNFILNLNCGPILQDRANLRKKFFTQSFSCLSEKNFLLIGYVFGVKFHKINDITY